MVADESGAEISAEKCGRHSGSVPPVAICGRDIFGDIPDSTALIAGVTGVQVTAESKQQVSTLKYRNIIKKGKFQLKQRETLTLWAPQARPSGRPAGVILSLKAPERHR